MFSLCHFGFCSLILYGMVKVVHLPNGNVCVMHNRKGGWWLECDTVIFKGTIEWKIQKSRILLDLPGFPAQAVRASTTFFVSKHRLLFCISSICSYFSQEKSLQPYYNKNGKNYSLHKIFAPFTVSHLYYFKTGRKRNTHSLAQGIRFSYGECKLGTRHFYRRAS